MEQSNIEKEIKLEDAIAKYIKEHLRIKIETTRDYYSKSYFTVSLVLDEEKIASDTIDLPME